MLQGVRGRGYLILAILAYQANRKMRQSLINFLSYKFLKLFQRLGKGNGEKTL